MDYKRSKAPTNTETHNLMDFCKGTDNIYESIVIMSKRANQISVKMKEDLSKKLKEFASGNDNLEETFENREQIEFHAITRSFPSLLSFRLMNISMTKYISVIQSKKKKN